MSNNLITASLLDLLNLVNTQLDAPDLATALMYADILLLLSVHRTLDSNIDMMKALLEQLGSLIGPYQREQGLGFNSNIFSPDLSKLTLDKLEAFASKRLSLYEQDLVDKVKSILPVD